MSGRTVDVMAVLQAIAEPHRQELVRLLQTQQLSQRQFVQVLGISQPLLSHHLKVLREAGLLESTVCERIRVYRLRADTLQELSDRLADMAAQARGTSSVAPC